MAEDLVLDTAIRDWVLITLSVSVVMVLIGILRYFVFKLMRSSQLPHAKIENGLLYVPKGQAQNALAQMFSDPNLAMDMMKKNLSMIIPQTLTFAWVNFFFSGFVAATDDTEHMMQMSRFAFDPTKSLSAEKDSLHIVQHNWTLPEFELSAEAVRRKLVS